MSGLLLLLRRLLVGKSAYFCAECGQMTDPHTEVKVLPMVVFCSDEHATLSQQTSPV